MTSKPSGVLTISIIIDTNIWAYYFDHDSPEHNSVVGPIEKALRSEQIAINTIIIMELAHFLIKNLGPIEGGEKLSLFLRFPMIISDFDYKSSLESVDMLKKYSHLGIGGRDATILTLMHRDNVNKIMTHDESLKRVDWVKASDPIAKK